MQTLTRPRQVAAGLRHFSSGFDWLAPLAVRLVFGYFWVETGWSKLQHLDAFAARFAQWGILFPQQSAIACAVVEFGGGLLMMLGLATRFTMLAMIVNMLVALIVVVLPEVTTLAEFVELDEVLYVLVFLWLLIAGAGRVSADAWVLRRLER